MRLRPVLKVGVVLLCVVAGVLGYGNRKRSALHRYVCGSDSPYPLNMMWLLYGESTIDNWPARLCGCKPPPGWAEYKAKAQLGFHWENGQLEYTGNNYAAVQLAIALRQPKNKKMKDFLMIHNAELNPLGWGEGTGPEAKSGGLLPAKRVHKY
jgi:hypothetical protein